MNNNAFYRYCRAQRKKEPDDDKRMALKEIYDFMWQCGVTRKGVNRYIDARIKVLESKNNQGLLAAYKWLRKVFADPASQTLPGQGQQTLLGGH